MPSPTIRFPSLSHADPTRPSSSRKVSSSASSSSSESASSSSSSSSGYLSSSDDIDSEEERIMIQEEWEESLRQIQALVSIVIMPFFGRWYGRKWSFWAYERYRVVGLTRKFFGV